MKSNNPLLTEENLRALISENIHSNAMTLNGSITKIASSLSLMTVAGVIGYFASAWKVSILALPICAIIALVCVFTTTFRKNLAPITVPIYAISQGFFLGNISFVYANEYSGILLPAFGLTIGTLAGMLLLYRLEIIKATEQFYSAVFAATFGVFVMALFQMLMYAFGITKSFNSFGIFGLIIQLIVVGVAALNLIVDFDFIVKASQKNLPKYMEWYSAMILLVTLVWLYVEILKLIARFARRK